MTNGRNSRPDFRDSIGNINARFRYLDIDLSTARGNAREGIAGAFVWTPVVPFDSASVKSVTLETGHCFIRFGSPNADPVYIDSGKTFNLIPFDEVFITNPAQTGKMLRLYYANDERISPFLTETAITIGNVTIAAHLLGANFKSDTTILGVKTLVTAEANVNGLVLRYIVIMWQTPIIIGIFAGATAPAGVQDPDTRIIAGSASTGQMSGPVLPMPILIPAGEGLFLAGTGVSSNVQSIGYDLL